MEWTFDKDKPQMSPAFQNLIFSKWLLWFYSQITNVFTLVSCFVDTYACQYVIDSKVGLNRLLKMQLMHMWLIPVKLCLTE